MSDDQTRHAKQTLTSLRAARRRCDAFLASLGVTTPFGLREFVERLATVRGRPIELVGDSRPGQVGLWVEQADRDLIFFPQETSQFHKLLISLHELAHMILDHEACDAVDDLLPHLSTDTIRRVLCRNSRSTEEEREAELFASVLLEHTAASHRHPNPGAMRPIEAFLAGQS
jgi:Zn-dependent peptidase ImmA (M78 family)